jgi:archaellum biogenesis ATPase FlaH
MKKQIKQQDISLEASLLKALAIQDNYNKFINVLDKKRLIPITNDLLKDYKKYYDTYNTDIDWGVFYTEFAHNWHKRDMDEHDLNQYKETIFPLVQNAVVDDNVFVALLEREATNKIEEIISKGLDPNKVSEVLNDLEQKKAVYSKNTLGMLRMTDVDLEGLDNTGGVTWCLPSLQAGLGSIMPGQFILLSADSNVGKSALAITQVAHTLKLKLEKPILYFDSEHTDKELRCRILANLYKDKVAEGFDGVWKEWERVYKHYDAEYGPDRFYTERIQGANDLNKIESLVEKYDPCLVVVDMIDIMSPSLSIQDITPLYNRIRSIANKGYAVIGTTQAGNTSYMHKDEATGKVTYKTRKWLTEKDTSGSKGGGKQGAAYCMIMIGKDDEMENIRYVTTTKKKRGKNTDITCEYVEDYSFYKELL